MTSRHPSTTTSRGALRHSLWLFVCLIALSAHTQTPATTAPLTLFELLNNASQFYPALQAARVEARASSEDTAAIRRQRWPTMSVISESHTGNVRSVPSSALQVQQTLWDFGRLSSRIEEVGTLEQISEINIHLQQQEVFLQVIAAWQNLLTSQARVRVALTTLARLQAYQAQMRRRVEAEASPRIDLELVDARLLQTEVERTTAQTSLQVALIRLEQLTGLTQLPSRLHATPPLADIQEAATFAKRTQNTDWQSVAMHSPLVAKAQAQLRQAQHKLDGKKSESFPQVYVRAYKPLNTIPSSQDTSPTAFVGLSYNPGAGLSTYAEAQALGTRITSAQLAIESARLEVQQSLQSEHEELVNARLRMSAIQKAVEGSELVLASYKRQFEAGKKNWLDVLNVVRELAQNQYNQADTRGQLMGAMYRLQLRMGSFTE